MGGPREIEALSISPAAVWAVYVCWLCVIVYLQSLFSVELFSNSHLKLVNGTVFHAHVSQKPK